MGRSNPWQATARGRSLRGVDSIWMLASTGVVTRSLPDRPCDRMGPSSRRCRKCDMSRQHESSGGLPQRKVTVPYRKEDGYDLARHGKRDLDDDARNVPALQPRREGHRMECASLPEGDGDLGSADVTAELAVGEMREYQDISGVP